MENDIVVAPEEDEIEELPQVEEGQEDSTDWKALALKNQGIAKRMKTKLQKAAEVKTEVVAPVVEKPKTGMPTGAEDIKSILKQELEERDLEQLEVSDKLKEEVQTYAKNMGVSVKKAMQSDYIQFRKEQEDQKAKVENASLSKGRKGTAKKDYSETQATDFDLTTPEGKAGFKEYKEWLKTQ